MVKLKGPLLSLSASGSIGDVLTFSKRKIVNQVRYQRGQKDYENPARKTQRDAYRFGIELWNYLPDVEKAYWDEIEQKGYADV